MKLKLMFVLMIVSNLCCDVVRASQQPLLNNIDSNSLPLPGIGDVDEQCLWIRNIATKAEKDYSENRYNESKTSKIIKTLNKDRDDFLMNCHSTTGILKIKKDNFWHHDLPQCICCCCACCFKSDYELAQHNVIEAIAFVEKDIKSMER